MIYVGVPCWIYTYSQYIQTSHCVSGTGFDIQTNLSVENLLSSEADRIYYISWTCMYFVIIVYFNPFVLLAINFTWGPNLHILTRRNANRKKADLSYGGNPDTCTHKTQAVKCSDISVDEMSCQDGLVDVSACEKMCLEMNFYFRKSNPITCSCF